MFKTLLAVFFLAIIPVKALADPHISWAVENRFRLLASDPKTLSAENILLSEFSKTGTISADYTQIANLLRADHNTASPALYTSTHFNDKSGRYDSGYADPGAQTILVNLDNRDILDLQCTWFVNQKPAALVGVNAGKSVVSCFNTVKIQLPFSRPGFSAQADISVQVLGGRAFFTHVATSDRLVLIFGDSYASGEGNPDKPANMALVRAGISYRHRDWWYPNIQPIGGVLPTQGSADWWSNECHRSFFSPEMIAALKMAALDSHNSITVMSFACSGASVLDGLLTRQHGPPGEDRIKTMGFAPIAGTESQALQAVTALCAQSPVMQDHDFPTNITFWNVLYYGVSQNAKPQLPTCPQWRRTPDLIFLTIGGNDIGFAGVGAWAVLPETGPVTQIAELIATQRQWNKMFVVCPTVPYPPPPNPGLPDPRCLFGGSPNPGATDLALHELPSLLDFTESSLRATGLLDHAKVVHVAYPAPFKDQHGQSCGTLRSPTNSNGEFASTNDLEAPWTTMKAQLYDIPGFNLGVTAKRAEDAESYAYDNLILTIRMNAQTKNWIFAPPPARYSTHGFCSGTGNLKDDFGFPEALPSLFSFLTWDSRFPLPKSWDPYASRPRWIRVSNDSVLTEMVSDAQGKVLQEAYSGTFHPTAEGEFAVADEIYAAVSAVAP